MGRSDERATNPYLYQGVYEGNHHVIRGLPTSEVLFMLQSREIERIARTADTGVSMLCLLNSVRILRIQ